MVMVKNFKEAVESLQEMLEVQDIAVYTGSKVKFSSLDKKNIEKIMIAIQNSYKQIGFEMGLQEVDIINNDNVLKIYFNKTQAVVIKLNNPQLINESVLENKVKIIFNFL